MINVQDENKEQIELVSLETKLSKIRDNITLNDAEVIRLKGLISSLDYQVRELHNSQVSLEEKNKALVDDGKELIENKTSLEKIILRLNKKIDFLRTKRKTIKSNIKKLTDGKCKQYAILNEKKSSLDLRETEIQEKGDQLAKLETELQEKEKLLNSDNIKITQAKDKIVEVINSLK